MVSILAKACLGRYPLILNGVLAVLSLSTMTSHAHPVAYKGATQLMLGWNENIQTTELFYSFEATQAFGIHAMRLSDDDVERDLLSFQYNRLLRRWNLEDAQGNLYAGMGLGTAFDGFDESWSTLGNLSLQADYETRHYYTAYRVHAMLTEKFAHVTNSFSLGIAPYQAEYEDLNTWLIVEIKHTSEFHDQLEILPKLRFFKNNVFFEAGATLEGKIQLNLMIHF